MGAQVKRQKSKIKGQKSNEKQVQRQDLGDRLVEFAARIVRLVSSLPTTTEGRHIGRQLLKSGTSPGAQYEEARAAESQADFVHKLQVGLKEMRETVYWLRVTSRSALLKPDLLIGIIDEAHQLRAMLSKGVARAKGTNK